MINIMSAYATVPGPTMTETPVAESASCVQSPKGFDWMGVLPMVAVFAVFYFFMIRPQQKKMKQQREMLAALKVGDRVLTTGGMVGTITKLENEQYAHIDIADHVIITVTRSSVAEVLKDGEVKTPSKAPTAKQKAIASTTQAAKPKTKSSTAAASPKKTKTTTKKT